MFKLNILVKTFLHSTICYLYNHLLRHLDIQQEPYCTSSVSTQVFSKKIQLNVIKLIFLLFRLAKVRRLVLLEEFQFILFTFVLLYFPFCVYFHFLPCILCIFNIIYAINFLSECLKIICVFIKKNILRRKQAVTESANNVNWQ
jgi:hypothetical protein